MIKDTRNQITKEQEKFKNYLKANGLRLTGGRKNVFDEVMHAHGHFATEELVKRCHAHTRKVSRATVYRCVKELLEAGVIRATAYGDKHQHFEHIYDEQPHHHAHCIRCNAQIEFPDLGEDEIYQSVMARLRFKVLGHEMHFYGICVNCAGNNKES